METAGPPLLALTLLGLLVGTIVAVATIARGRPRAARYIALLAGAWIAAYATVLVVTSFASRERLLTVGEAKRFCGFYLDCHMGVAVERVDTTSSMGPPGEEMRAGGTFYVVTLRVSSDARRAALHLDKPRVEIVDAEGFRYERSLEAERTLASAQLADLEQPVNAGESFSRVVVIDVPHGARNPRLHVTMGGPLDRAVELVLIGDEDALFHAPTLHALTAGSGLSSASVR
jgi:Domain of unknown function (DUF4352)